MSAPTKSDLHDEIRTLEQKLQFSEAARIDLVAECAAAERSVEISAENRVKILREVEMLKENNRSQRKALLEAKLQVANERSAAKYLLICAGHLFSTEDEL